MNKKVVIGAILLIAVIAVLVFASILNKKTVKEECAPGDDQCFEELALKTDINLATENLSEQEKIREIAVKTKDESLCNALSGSNKDWCIVAVAEAKGDSGMCGTLGGFAQQDCFSRVASATGNESLCEKVTSEWDRDDCYLHAAIAVLDEKKCEGIKTIEEKNNCFATIAFETGNSDLCNKITDDDEDLKQACFYETNPNREPAELPPDFNAEE